jgi:hypothetical protein
MFMKQVEKKLSLNKMTVSKLNFSELEHVKGGEGETWTLIPITIAITTTIGNKPTDPERCGVTQRITERVGCTGGSA